MLVIAAGLVLIGGSAIGGIAYAASRTDTPATHPQTSSSPGDRGISGEDSGKQDSEHPTTTPMAGATCTPDKDADDATGGHEGNPTASRSPEADDLQHSSGTASPTPTGTHHDETPDAMKSPEPTNTSDTDHHTTRSSCDDD
jgi:hypothetical protein